MARKLMTQTNINTVILTAAATAIGISVFAPLLRDVMTWVRSQTGI